MFFGTQTMSPLRVGRRPDTTLAQNWMAHWSGTDVLSMPTGRLPSPSLGHQSSRCLYCFLALLRTFAFSLPASLDLFFLFASLSSHLTLKFSSRGMDCSCCFLKHMLLNTYSNSLAFSQSLPRAHVHMRTVIRGWWVTRADVSPRSTPRCFLVVPHTLPVTMANDCQGTCFSLLHACSPQWAAGGALIHLTTSPCASCSPLAPPDPMV